MYKFTAADLVEGILTRSLSQLNLQTGNVPVQIIDGEGTVRASIPVTWGDNSISVDLSQQGDITGQWKLIFDSTQLNPSAQSSGSTCNIICLTQVKAGQGGIGGGGGYDGQTSIYAQGSYVTSYGIPVIKISTGMTAQFVIQLTKDLQGTVPSDLTNITKIEFVCLTTGEQGKNLFKVECSNIGSGRITLRLTPKQVNYRQGLHYAEVHCYNGKVLTKVYKCCLQIEKSFVGSNPDTNYPLTIAQVRMALYDTSGRNNELLNDLQFSDIVIARGMQRAIADWNQMPPTLSCPQTLATFPYKSNLCTGAVGHVFSMAAYRYYRNQMRHVNAGLTLDDNDKGAIYMSIADKTIAEWRAWVQAKKNELNLLQCMGSISDGLMQSASWW